MICLQVPYAQKDAAKALGARWSQDKKTWYVPHGMLATSFERWMPAADLPALPSRKCRPVAKKSAPEKSASKRVDEYVGKTIVGANYFDVGHDCNPFVECATCRPALESSGWAAASRATSALIEKCS